MSGKTTAVFHNAHVIIATHHRGLGYGVRVASVALHRRHAEHFFAPSSEVGVEAQIHDGLADGGSTDGPQGENEHSRVDPQRLGDAVPELNDPERRVHQDRRSRHDYQHLNHFHFRSRNRVRCPLYGPAGHARPPNIFRDLAISGRHHQQGHGELTEKREHGVSYPRPGL